MRAAEIWERWFVATVLAPVLGQGRAMRRIAELAEIRDRLLTEATIAPTADVLDLGCGTGMLTYPAGEEAGHAVGVDRVEPLLRAARSVPAIGGIFACSDAAALPFPAGAFDVVIWRGLLSYASRRREILSEAFRVLRPEGRLCFAEPLTAEMDVPGKDEAMQRIWETFREVGTAALSEQWFSRYTLEALIEGAGFRDVRVQAERRRTALEDARAVREVFDGEVPGGISLTALWRGAGVPAELVGAFLEALIAQTPMQILTPEGYTTASKPRGLET